MYETLQLEIIAVLESLNQLRESPDYELCQISEKRLGVLDELAAERERLLEKESAELDKQAGQLADEIKELSGPDLRAYRVTLKPELALFTWNLAFHVSRVTRHPSRVPRSVVLLSQFAFPVRHPLLSVQSAVVQVSRA
jgi:hypothetical protein